MSRWGWRGALLSYGRNRLVVKIKHESKFFFFWPHPAACRILVPRPGTEPVPLQWKHGVLTTGLPGNSLKLFSCPQSAIVSFLPVLLFIIHGPQTLHGFHNIHILFSPRQRPHVFHLTIQSWQCRRKLETMGFLFKKDAVQLRLNLGRRERRDRGGLELDLTEQSCLPGEGSFLHTSGSTWCKLHSIKTAYTHIKRYTGCEAVHRTLEAIHRSLAS